MPKIIKVEWIAKIGIGAITIYPWIFTSSLLYLPHETIHWRDQQAWFRRAWLPGLFAWFFCYEFCLPFLWNPLRKATETRAYCLGDGYTPEKTAQILREFPYFLL